VQQPGYAPGYPVGPYGAQPGQPYGYRKPSALSSIVPKVLGGNLAGVILTAATAVATALVLSLIFGLVINSTLSSLMGDAQVSGLSLRVILGMWTGSVFGANMSLTMGGTSSGQMAMTIGFVPLGFTVLTLALTVIVWRRMTRHYTSVSVVIVDAIRVAIVAALLVLIVALVTTSSLTDSLGYTGGYSIKLGSSAVGAFFSTALVMAVVLILAGLTGRNLFSASVAPFAQAVGSAIKGLVAFAVVLTVVGLVMGIVSTTTASNDIPSSLPLSGNITGLAAASAVAYCGAFGLWYAALGAFGTVQASVNGQVIPNASTGLAGMASSNNAWWLLVLLPLGALAVGAIVAVRGHHTRRDALGTLGTFCVSVLVAVPIFGHFANLRLSLNTTGYLATVFDMGIGDLLNSLGLPYGTSAGSLDMSAGANLVSGTFLIFLFALVVSFLVALASGVVINKQPPAQAFYVMPGAPYPQAGYGYQQPVAGWMPQPMQVPQPVPQQVVDTAPPPAARSMEYMPPQPSDLEAMDTTMINPAATLPVCPVCGNQQPVSARFCDNCGTPLASRAQ